MAVVCDAGPLIHLDELGCLDLLSDFSHVLIPETVWRETLKHRPGILLPSDSPIEHIAFSDPIGKRLLALSQLFTLHRGELEALQLCLVSQNRFLLTDDTAARLAANQLGLRAHGTIGILLRAIRRAKRSRDQVIDLLRILPTHSTLFIRRDLLEEVIANVLSCD